MEITPYFSNLGLHRRAGWLIQLARQLLVDPPKPYILRKKGAGSVCSEVAHLRGVDRYASDAWRIFCKDAFYRAAERGLLEPEWKLVVPEDKALVKYITWRWSLEGFTWTVDSGPTRIGNGANLTGLDLSFARLTVGEQIGFVQELDIVD